MGSQCRVENINNRSPVCSERRPQRVSSRRHLHVQLDDLLGCWARASNLNTSTSPACRPVPKSWWSNCRTPNHEVFPGQIHDRGRSTYPSRPRGSTLTALTLTESWAVVGDDTAFSHRLTRRAAILCSTPPLPTERRQRRLITSRGPRASCSRRVPLLAVLTGSAAIAHGRCDRGPHRRGRRGAGASDDDEVIARPIRPRCNRTNTSDP
jgi:hypothetical protein